MNKVKKQEQEVINYVSKNLYDMAMNEACDDYGFMNPEIWHRGKRLNKCNARVYETENFYILESYSTIVAVIEKATDIFADVLRMVYGYTSTSCQHIAKFRRAYGKDKWGCKIEYTYRECN